MKITKRQLRQIIKEELLKETNNLDEGLLGDLVDKFKSLFNDPKKSGESGGYRFPFIVEYLKLSAEAETDEEMEETAKIIKENEKYVRNLIQELEKILS